MLQVTVVARLTLFDCKLKGCDASAFALLMVILKISFGCIGDCLGTLVSLNVASGTLLKYTIFFELAQEEIIMEAEIKINRGKNTLGIFYLLSVIIT